VAAADNDERRQEKILGIGLPSLFSITPYTCELKDNLGSGTCYTLLDCLKKNGTAHGKCAGIFGVCCLVGDVEGNTTITANGGTFTSPGFSSSARSLDAREGRALEDDIYVAVLTPSSDKVQMLLEFIGFDIMGPTEGDCDKDMFEIVGNPGRAQVPILCGENAGQHMYIDISNFDVSTDEMSLKVTLSSDVYDRKWKIEVSYFTEYQTSDPRCLQYFTETSGSIMSFNYGDNAQNLNDQMYSVCFAYLSDYCDIGFTFTQLDLGNSIGDCMDDYVQLQSMSLCGYETNYAVTGNATGPISLLVSSGSANANLVAGFEVDYTMMEC